MMRGITLRRRRPEVRILSGAPVFSRKSGLCSWPFALWCSNSHFAPAFLYAFATPSRTNRVQAIELNSKEKVAGRVAAPSDDKQKFIAVPNYQNPRNPASSGSEVLS